MPELSAVGEWLLPAGLVLALDQASKGLVLARVGDGSRHRSGPGPSLRRATRSPIALGLVRDRRMLTALWVAGVAGTALLVHGVEPFQGQLARFGLGAAVGGATGNLIDTLVRGAVVDFIDLRIWPVFNVADAALVVGVAVGLGSALGSAA